MVDLAGEARHAHVGGDEEPNIAEDTDDGEE